MQPSVSFGAEVGALVVGWALVLVAAFRRVPTVEDPGQPHTTGAGGAKTAPAGAPGLAVLVALAAFTVIALLDGLKLGPGPSLIDAVGGWCLVGVILRRGAAAKSALASSQPARQPGPAGTDRARRRFPVIPVMAINIAIFVVCLLYYWGGQPAARMIALAAVAYVTMNATALVTWKLRRDR